MSDSCEFVASADYYVMKKKMQNTLNQTTNDELFVKILQMQICSWSWLYIHR